MHFIYRKFEWFYWLDLWMSFRQSLSQFVHFRVKLKCYIFNSQIPNLWLNTELGNPYRQNMRNRTASSFMWHKMNKLFMNDATLHILFIELLRKSNVTLATMLFLQVSARLWSTFLPATVNSDILSSLICGNLLWNLWPQICCLLSRVFLDLKQKQG